MRFTSAIVCFISEMKPNLENHWSIKNKEQLIFSTFCSNHWKIFTDGKWVDQERLVDEKELLNKKCLYQKS